VLFSRSRFLLFFIRIEYNRRNINNMDIFSHGLWAAAAAKGVNKSQNKRRVNVWATAMWGIFPDLFAFVIPFAWMIVAFISGDISGGDFHVRPAGEELTNPNMVVVSQFSHALYNMSHSLFIFAIVFLGVWLYFRQARLELLGWLLHIVIDIPTHTAAFFPTPIFWPFFDWKFLYGFSWGQPWFLILNYSLLACLYLYFWKGKKKLYS